MTNPITTPNEERVRACKQLVPYIYLNSDGPGTDAILAESLAANTEGMIPLFYRAIDMQMELNTRPQSGLSAGDRGELEEVEAVVRKTYNDVWAADTIREVLSSAPTETEEDRELRALAEKVIAKSPWRASDGYVWTGDGNSLTHGYDGYMEDEDCAYVAACSPDRIISLLDRLAGKGK